jgi:BirA family biotin operon repressor/biotin-[acetyl-CoA-carboxylase] ligase
MSNKIVYTIVGIGLNINQLDFPDYIPNPISASQICGISFQIEQCIRNLLSDIINRYPHSLKNQEKLKREYLDSLYRFNKVNQFIYNQVPIFAKITDVNPYGMLCLTTNEGTKIECGFKEISYII